MPFNETELSKDVNHKKIYGYLIRKARNEAEISLSFLADITYVNKSHLSKIEHGDSTPSNEYKIILEKALEVSINVSDEIINEMKHNKCEYLECWATNNTEGMNSVVTELNMQAEKYVYSIAVGFYYVILLLHNVSVMNDLNECDSLITEIETISYSLDEDFMRLFIDAKALYYLKKGDIKKGLSLLEKIVGKDIAFKSDSLNDALIHSHASAAYSLLGKNYDAKANYEKMREILMVLFYFERIILDATVLANGYAMSRCYRQSLELNSKILDYFKRNNRLYEVDMIHSNICYCYLLMAEYTKALEEINKIFDFENSGSCMYYYEPFIYYCLNDIESAKRTYAKNVAYKGNDEESFFMLGIIDSLLSNNLKEAEIACGEIDTRFGNQINNSTLLFAYSLALKVFENSENFKMKSYYLEKINHH